jgi:hypothetical protein
MANRLMNLNAKIKLDVIFHFIEQRMAYNSPGRTSSKIHDSYNDFMAFCLRPPPNLPQRCSITGDIPAQATISSH